MKIPDWYLSLSELQKAYLISLRNSGLEGAALAGFFLLLKEDIPAMEEVVVWVYEEHPEAEEVACVLTDYIKER